MNGLDTGTVYCEHGRTNGSCEECAFIEAAEKGRVTGDLYPPTVPDDAVYASEDTLVPDPLVEGRFTLVKAGDPLPTEPPANASEAAPIHA